jgi:hypothetical protein
VCDLEFALETRQGFREEIIALEDFQHDRFTVCDTDGTVDERAPALMQFLTDFKACLLTH